MLRRPALVQAHPLHLLAEGLQALRHLIPESDRLVVRLSRRLRHQVAVPLPHLLYQYVPHLRLVGAFHRKSVLERLVHAFPHALQVGGSGKADLLPLPCLTESLPLPARKLVRLPPQRMIIVQ